MLLYTVGKKDNAGSACLSKAASLLSPTACRRPRSGGLLRSPVNEGVEVRHPLSTGRGENRRRCKRVAFHAHRTADIEPARRYYFRLSLSLVFAFFAGAPLASLATAPFRFLSRFVRQEDLQQDRGSGAEAMP